MTFAEHRLELGIEAAHEYARLSAGSDVVRAEQVSRTIDELVGYWDRGRDGTLVLRWPRSVERAAYGEQL
jgi:hypothetical protein